MTPTMGTHGAWAVVLAMVVAVGAAGCGGSESRKARHVEQGQQFMAERNYSKARLEFRNALQIDPKDAEARALAGLAAEKLGDVQEAVKLYRVSIAADENLVMPRANLARMMVMAGLTDEAQELVEPGLERNPQSAALLSVRGMILAQKGEGAAGRKDAERAVELEPSNSDASLVLALMMWREGEREQSVQFLEKSLPAVSDPVEVRLVLAEMLLLQQRPDQAVEQVREVIRAEPRKAAHRFRLAQIYLQQGKVTEAVATARDAVKANPADVDAKMSLVQLLADRNSFEEAEKELSAYMSESPTDFALHNRIAQFFESRGRDGDAERIYLNVMDQAGRKGQGLVAESRLAGLKLRVGQTDEAARLAEAVLKENPSDADALVTRANIAMERGDMARAIADLRVALGNQPDSVPLAVALSRAHVESGQTELAEQVLRSVVQTNPRDVQARFALAKFLFDSGKQQQARPVLEQLVSEQPNNMMAIEGLARLQMATKDSAGAMRSAATLQTLQPKSAVGFVLEGQAQESANANEAARKAYERAAEIDPTSIEPTVALVRLDLQAGRAEQALERVDGRLKATPNDAFLMTLRGDVLLALQRPTESVASYGAAIKVMPTFAQAYRGQAAAYLAAEMPEQAVQALKAGMVATRGSRALAWDLAGVYGRLGRVDDAIAVYDEVLARNPRDDATANNLTMLLVSRKGDADSLARAGRLAQRFADSTVPAFMDTYGWVLYKQGRHAEAASALSKAVERAPNSRELRYHLAMAQLKLGKQDDARVNLEAAVVAGSDYPGLEEARRTLAGL